MEVLYVFGCVDQVVWGALHEEGGVVSEGLSLGFVEGVDNASDVFAAGDFDKEYFDHDYKEVWGYDVPLGNSLLEMDGVG